MVPSRFLGEKHTGGNSGGAIQHQGSETAVQFFFMIVLADAAPLQNGATFFPDGTTRGSEARSHTTQTTSKWVASCSIMQANAHKRTTGFTLSFPSCQGRPAKACVSIAFLTDPSFTLLFVCRPPILPQFSSLILLTSRPYIIHPTGVVC